MLSKLRKKLSKKAAPTLLPPSAPVACYFDLPVEGSSRDWVTESLKIAVKLEVRTPVPFKTMDDCLKTLEVWVDDSHCPIWQSHLDTWCYLCLAVHLRRDPVCTYTNLYRAAIQDIVEFVHMPMSSAEVQYLKHEQILLSTFQGQQCEIRYWSELKPSTRKGVPAHAVYRTPLKNGELPPLLDKVAESYPLQVEYSVTGAHKISSP
uniref:Matrix protein n=1 Tax=Longquan Niviventer coninga ledantevirus 1 TaxID=2877507 RepID=A0A9E9C027_9RHAB|nr:MAG: hypothetical protein [Longquan Niviventer coninga ledantevirus 1]